MRPHCPGFVGAVLPVHMGLWLALEQDSEWLEWDMIDLAFSSQDSRSEHERQYLLCQGSSGVENTELVKSPRWDWLEALGEALLGLWPLLHVGRVKEGHCPWGGPRRVAWHR